MNVVTLWATTHHMAASCIYECLMVSHNEGRSQPNGDSTLYPSALLYVIFGSFLFCCWGVIARHPVRWLNYGHVPLTMGVMCCCLFTLSIIQESTKKSTPFFYFNCISFGYIWHPCGCLVAAWWGISVARSGQWLLNDNYYPIRIWVYQFLLYIVGKFFRLFWKRGLTFGPILV